MRHSPIRAYTGALWLGTAGYYEHERARRNLRMPSAWDIDCIDAPVNLPIGSTFAADEGWPMPDIVRRLPEELYDDESDA